MIDAPEPTRLRSSPPPAPSSGRGWGLLARRELGCFVLGWFAVLPFSAALVIGAVLLGILPWISAILEREQLTIPDQAAWMLRHRIALSIAAGVLLSVALGGLILGRTFTTRLLCLLPPTIILTLGVIVLLVNVALAYTEFLAGLSRL